MKSGNEKKVCVIGLGYIGLPTAAVLAMHKYRVHGVDISQKVVDTVNQGKIHIVEPELDQAVHQAVNSGYLKADTKAAECDVYVIAVPTPFKEPGHTPDMSYIQSAAQAIAPYLRKGNLVILESTSPVGATEDLSRWLQELRMDLRFPQKDQANNADIHLAYCPERVLPGQVLKELIDNERIIGGMTEKCADLAAEFYGVFVRSTCHKTNARTAEMAKLTENAYRDVNIAFANELSMICDDLDINVWELINFANRHPRVKILQPGCGVGGHCIAVDPWFIVHQNPEKAKIIHAARQVNDHKSEFVLEKVTAAIKDSGAGVAVFGLAFKPDIDDLRESPALEITHKLAKSIRNPIYVVEPNIEVLPRALNTEKNITLCDIDTALNKAEYLVFLVAHRHFRGIAAQSLSDKKVLDFAKALQ